MTSPGYGRGAPPFDQQAQESLAAARPKQGYRVPVVEQPLAEEDRKLAEQLADEDAKICKWCLGIHKWPGSPGCPRLASVELNGDGVIVKATFWPGTKWARGRLLFVEDAEEAAEDGI